MHSLQGQVGCRKGLIQELGGIPKDSVSFHLFFVSSSRWIHPRVGSALWSQGGNQQVLGLYS